MFGKNPSIATLTIGSVLLSMAVFQPDQALAQSKAVPESEWAGVDGEWVVMDWPSISKAQKPASQVLPQNETNSFPKTPIINPKNSQPSNHDMFVGAIAINGADQIGSEVFAPLVEQNIGRSLAEEELLELTQQIADMARDQGYIFSTAHIPEQSLALGVLQLEVRIGRIDEVRIVGSENRALGRLLKSLEGRAAVQKEIEVHFIVLIICATLFMTGIILYFIDFY